MSAHPPELARRIRAAGRILADARRVRDSLSPREAALLAYRPGGPSVDELTEMNERWRAEALAARSAQAAA
ncbi:hypothetical protein ACOQFV_27495 [Nocardiopsis changdeensis]|uniref:Uncharacterized protein n=1 Tax=Nocardiopsis changdeensis TaxID=2831969 RepID=A0ABX8BLF7_9ACTN|nr:MULTISPECIES: hypothetical protein [Nocardiopsis]QUX23011.1 hypothetical protein KGD84_00950 [Nocardiopsis changdeensis]QYX38956.1 hypothetical protein K1J57_10405 [Nocardiopsis sp. MT53]